MKKVTILGGVVDAVYLCEPPEGVEAVEASDEVFSGWLHDGTAFAAPRHPAPSIEDLRAAKRTDIETKSQALLSVGAPVAGGLHVALDDGSRADLTAMAATATAASAGAVPWPESYARGWITIENIRIPLAAPASGLALAASVGNHYAAVVQHRRDLKDQVLAAVDADALDAIDISAGWPA